MDYNQILGLLGSQPVGQPVGQPAMPSMDSLLPISLPQAPVAPVQISAPDINLQSLLQTSTRPMVSPALADPFAGGIPQIGDITSRDMMSQRDEPTSLLGALGQGIGERFSDPDFAMAFGTKMLQPRQYKVGLGQAISEGLLAGRQAQKTRTQEALDNLVKQAAIKKDLSEASGLKDLFKDETTLRKEYDNISEKFVEALRGYNKVKEAGLKENASGADDIALIFGFMKTVDPGSVVREGEFATAEQAGGVSDRVRNMYNKIVSGQRLTDRQRKMFVAAAQGQISAVAQSQKLQEQRYSRLADEYNFSAGRVVQRYSDELELLPEDTVKGFGDFQVEDVVVGQNYGTKDNPIYVKDPETLKTRYPNVKGIHYRIVGDDGKTITSFGVTD